MRGFAVGVMCLMLVGMAHAEAALTVVPNPVSMQLKLLDSSIKPTPAGGSVAVRMVLENPTDQPLRLVGASTPLAGQTQLQTYVQNEYGLTQVQTLKELPLPPKTEVLLLPGVLELQLIGLTTELKPGLELPLKLKFADGTERTVRLKIEGETE
ncbi:MAG: copper chaperone PCu(A)C [Blastochloris viridis]|uniref:Copper chaperone PCu(A)C n=1 Tax=Blastochloris viridis TaxID=1079 RepID=A0A6N4RFB4_BLAVI|nr:MAG: copper chaperone PCu(A)C [Blastochloris viridis]